MPTIEVNLPHHRYAIHIAPGLLGQVGELARQVAPHARAALLADDHVHPLYAPAVARALEHAGYTVISHAFPAGEQNKHLDTVRALYDVLLNARLERRSPILALGGGVTGDTVGFVAATYLRGVPLIQCPTTLLAMVDSSVGGKVGVDVPQGKNLIGAFHQPVLVIIDPLTLRTLPPRELRSGLAECVKHAVIRDPDLFAWTDAHLPAILNLDPDALTELVRRNVQIKANVVMADEKETGERAHLNFGHTFGHAIETTTGYSRYLHGEGVALGMVAATRLAVEAHLCPAEVLPQVIALLERIGLPTRAPGDALPDTESLMNAMMLDKKVADGRLRLVLPRRLGQVDILNDVPAARVRQAWETLRR